MFLIFPMLLRHGISFWIGLLAPVGVLNYAAAHDVWVIQFVNALRNLGYVEAKNVIESILNLRLADGGNIT